MVVIAETEQVDSPYYEALVPKRISMIQMALIGPAQQCCSHLPLEIKKTASFLPRISKGF